MQGAFLGIVRWVIAQIGEHGAEIGGARGGLEKRVPIPPVSAGFGFERPHRGGVAGEGLGEVGTQRAFSVSLQGKPALKDFDIAKEAGGPRRAIVRTFNGVEVTGSLTIDLTPSAASRQALPVLCGIEAVREEP